jgi:uncharacterized protein (TIGR02145 family)
MDSQFDYSRIIPLDTIIKYYFSLGTMTAIMLYGFISCDDLEITNPNDPNYELSQPTLLTAESELDSTITLMWRDNEPNETGFIIERDGGSGFAEIGTVSADVTEYTDSGLNYGKYYKYRVAAYTLSNTSNYSESAACSACVNCIVDYDGNVYKTIQIGSQLWMAENLKVTHYTNGTAIPNLLNASEWIASSSGAYSYYDNLSGNSDTHGALYNWYAAAHYNIAPEGWHLPTDAEWQTLINYLGGNSIAGGKLKEVGTEYWDSPNSAATNESGFTAQASGYRDDYNGDYDNMGYSARFWAVSTYNANFAYNRTLNYNSSECVRSTGALAGGFSVRLLKD